MLQINNMKIQSYHTGIYANNGSAYLSNFKVTRFQETDLNQIVIYASEKVVAQNYESSSSTLDIQGVQGVSIYNLDIKVNSQEYSPQGKHTFSISSEKGDVEISGSQTNRYYCRDIKIAAGRDIKINFITLLLTGYSGVGSPIPNVNIQAIGELEFKEAASISGGHMLFRGRRNLTFADQTSLMSTAQDGQSPSNYSLTLVSEDGPLHCQYCHLASDGPVAILAARDISGQLLKIDADQDESTLVQIMQATLVVKSEYGGIQFAEQVKLRGNIVVIDAGDGPIFASNGFEVISSLLELPKDLKFRSILIRAAQGTSELKSGIIQGPNIQLDMPGLTLSNMILESTQGLLYISCQNHSLTSQSNVTIKGGHIFLQGYEGISIQQGYTIESNSLLFQSTHLNHIELHSQGVITLSSGLMTASSNIMIDARTQQGEIRVIQSIITSKDKVTLQSRGNLWLTSMSNITASQIYIASNQSIQAKDKVELLYHPESALLNDSYVEIKGYESIQTSEFSIKLFTRIDIDSNNSVTMGKGTLRMHDLDIKAKVQIKAQDLQIYTSRSIFMNSQNITLKTTTMKVNTLQTHTNHTLIRLLARNYLKIDLMSHFEAGTFFLQGSSGMIINQSALKSTIRNMCNEMLPGSKGNDLFYCIKKSTIEKELSEERFMQSFRVQYYGNQEIQKFKLINETFKYIESNYTTFLLSYGQILIQESDIQTPRLGTCSSDLNLMTSEISTVGLGCPADSGLGKGLQKEGCAATGASHSGIGGFGAKDKSDRQNPDCSRVYPNPIQTREIDAQYEGSGGATSVTKLYKNLTRGGSGGGIVWMSTSYKLKIKDSEIKCDGSEGTQMSNQSAEGEMIMGSGGGSGGSIQILTSYLEGNGYLSVVGGQGSIGGGGGGSGGRIVLNFLGNYLANFYDQHTFNWAGTLDLIGGQSGPPLTLLQIPGAPFASNGTEWHPQCLAGYSGPFCEPCPISTYKYGYSYGRCLPCVNKPENGFYTDKASTNAQCKYQCLSGLEGVEINPDCLNHIELQITRILGDMYLTLGVIGVFLLLTLIQWLCLIHRKSALTKAYNPRDKMTLDLDQEDEQQNTLNLSAATFLRYHVYRLYLTGYNSISLPWSIPIEDIPLGALAEQDLSNLEQIATKTNFKWNPCQTFTFQLLSTFFPSIALKYQNRVKQMKYRNLRDTLISSFDQDFWDNHLSNQSFRLTLSPADPSLSYLDFVDFAKSFDSETYKGPKLPIVIMIAGNGSYQSQYTVEYESDPCLKALVYVDHKSFKKGLPVFFANLNSLLAKLNFNKFTGLVLRDLDTLLEYIDLGNKRLFHPANMSLTLYIFDNTYKSDKQKRKSFPLNSQLFEAFPQTFKKLIQYLKYKLGRMNNSGMNCCHGGKKEEVRFGLVFQKMSESKKKKQEKLEERNQAKKQERKESIKKSNKKDNQLLDSLNQADYQAPAPKYGINFSIQQGDDLFEDYLSDDSYEGDFKDYDDTYTDILDTQENDDIISQQQQLRRRSTVTGRSASIKYKSEGRKRAFTISKESTKSMEVALNKDRSKCRHKMAKFSAFFYAVYLVIFKTQKTPPTRGQYSLYLMLALLITVDLLVSMSFGFHLSYPKFQLTPTVIVYLFIYPGLSILSPVLGLLSTFSGSQKFMIWHTEVNSMLCLVNYPLTMLIQMLSNNEKMFYVLEILTLLLLKVLIQFISAKVRADFANPIYNENLDKLKHSNKSNNSQDEESD